jgi:putative spermidine/putrescine transport system substrate-binding protein
MGELSRRLLLTAAALGLLAGTPARAADTTLNVLTAGDQNMVDYVNEFLAPRFEAQHPGVRVQAAGTGRVALAITHIVCSRRK